MVNKLRLLLLVSALAIIAVSSYYLLDKINTPIGTVNLKPMKPGVDIEIENFRLINQDSNARTWELTADRAQLDKENNRTELKNVELKLDQGTPKEFRISADSGVLTGEGQEINLVGNVKLTGQHKAIMDQINAPDSDKN